MGVGFPRDIVAAVDTGIDMFDCVMPTRNGRNAYAFTGVGPIRLRNSQLSSDTRARSRTVATATPAGLLRAAPSAISFLPARCLDRPCFVHNMRFYQRLMEDVRRSIETGTFRSSGRPIRDARSGRR